MAKTSSGFLVVWGDDGRDGSKNIYVRAFDFDGAPITGADSRVSESTNDSEMPGICSSGNLGGAMVFFMDNAGASI